MNTQRRSFFRRARNYLLLMLIPTVLLLGTYLISAVRTQNATLLTEGQVTMSTVTEYCSLTLDHVLAQNDMLSGTTRVLMVLRRMLFSAKMSYSDTTIFNMLKTTLNSLVNSDGALQSIYYWLDDSPKVFTTSGSGIILLQNMEDTSWLQVYRNMDTQHRTCVYANTDNNRKSVITVVVQLLTQDGCFVVNIDASQWQKKLSTMLHREEEALFLLDEEGNLLLSVTNSDSVAQLTQEDLDSLNEAIAGTWVDIRGRAFLFETNAGKHIRFITLVPRQVLYGRIRGILGPFLTVMCIDLLIVSLLSWLVTRKITRQLHRMIDMFDHAMHGLPIEKPEDGMRDEYAIIMNNIAYMYLRDTTMQTKMKEETLQKENAELMALQLQINPHFLYNTLQTIDFAILSDNADKQDISDALHDLSDILRYSLSNPEKPVSLGLELEKLRSYADIQRFRFGNKFVLYFDVDDALRNAEVFRMILQPVVENSMVHGLNGLKERGHIWVTAERKNDLLQICVKDTGVGMTEEERLELLARINSPDSRSIGLTNLNRRLILRYGQESRISIASEPGKGTTVSFLIPFKEMDV